MTIRQEVWVAQLVEHLTSYQGSRVRFPVQPFPLQGVLAVPPAETPVCEPFLPLLPTKFGEFVRFSKGRKIKNPMWSRIQFIHWIWLQSPYGIRGNIMYSLINSIGRALLGLHHFGPTPHLPVCFFHLWFCHFFFWNENYLGIFFLFFSQRYFYHSYVSKGRSPQPLWDRSSSSKCSQRSWPVTSTTSTEWVRRWQLLQTEWEIFSNIFFFFSFWKKYQV